jgi:hypothetical protein
VSLVKPFNHVYVVLSRTSGSPSRGSDLPSALLAISGEACGVIVDIQRLVIVKPGLWRDLSAPKAHSLAFDILKNVEIAGARLDWSAPDSVARSSEKVLDTSQTLQNNGKREKDDSRDQ